MCLYRKMHVLIFSLTFIKLCFLQIKFIVLQPKSGVLIVGDFMTKKEELHVVKPTTTVDEGISHSVKINIHTLFQFSS